MVGTPEFRQRYVEPTVIESAEMFQTMFENHMVQGGMSATTVDVLTGCRLLDYI